jgi:hypothetical protein
MTFIEPTRRFALRWGGYNGRYAASIVLIASGLVCLQGTSGSISITMALGSAAHALGWWLLPGSGRRRGWASVASLAVAWVLLIGPSALGLLGASLACWLWVRERTALSYLVVLPVLATGVIARSINAEYSGMLAGLAATGVVLIAAAWAARAITISRATSAAKRNTSAHRP